MGHNLHRSPALALGAALFITLLAGCSGGDSVTLTPTPQETRTIGNDSAVTFPTSNVRVVTAPDSFNPGESVDLGVILNPSDLPQQARTPSIHEKVASVVITDSTDSGTTIQNPINIRIPLLNKNGLDNNTSLRLFRFDEVLGRWINTSRSASTADDTNSASFTADDYGTYGLFRAIPLSASIDPTRTNGTAPFSVGLTAVIRGGTPPYTVIWYFGDDSDPEVGETVAHQYKDPFTYNCTITVTDASNEVASSFVDLRAY